ncbi:MAG TPA: MFS transporter [Rhizomicrobium sp.]|nr:MFS transporter [Rhizomicrobium sp.]
MSPRSLSLISILSACVAAGLGMGLTLPLLSLILERMGIAGSVNGLNLATAGLAALLITPQAPRLMRRFGASAFLATCLVIAAAALIAIYAAPSLWLWFPVRFVLSAALNGLFVVSEFWINQLADERNRGRMIALYAICLSIGFGAGPVILSLIGTRGILPFVAGAAMLLLAAIPVILARRGAPRIEADETHSPFAAIRAAPTMLAAGFVFGAIDAGMAGLFPVYAVRSGYSEADAALAVTAISIGGIIFQYPLGLIADRVNRTTLLAICASSGILGTLVTPFVVHQPVALYAVLVLWGGIIMGVYTVGLTLLGERFKGPQLASANAAYVMMYSFGMLLGPAAEGVGLDAWNPNGLLVVLGVISALYAVFLLFRPRRNPTP